MFYMEVYYIRKKGSCLPQVKWSCENLEGALEAPRSIKLLAKKGIDKKARNLWSTKSEVDTKIMNRNNRQYLTSQLKINLNIFKSAVPLFVNVINISILKFVCSTSKTLKNKMFSFFQYPITHRLVVLLALLNLLASFTADGKITDCGCI